MHDRARGPTLYVNPTSTFVIAGYITLGTVRSVHQFKGTCLQTPESMIRLSFAWTPLPLRPSPIVRGYIHPTFNCGASGLERNS